MHVVKTLLLALVVSSTLAAGTAKAIVQTLSPPCTVTAVKYQPVVSGNSALVTTYRTLSITCSDSTSYTANLSATATTTCPQLDADSAKSILSLAQAARLSGKPLQITYYSNASCNGISGTYTANVIMDVSL
jgi:hypothetical protein